MDGLAVKYSQHFCSRSFPEPCYDRDELPILSLWDQSEQGDIERPKYVEKSIRPSLCTSNSLRSIGIQR